MAVRVVYDSMVIVQGALKETGPPSACLHLAESGRAVLLLSPSIVDKLGDVLLRDELRRKSPNLTDESDARFLERIKSFAELKPEPPSSFSLPRDPKDEPYLNLAIAAGAYYLISWNERHLNYLMRADTPEGKDFCARYPRLKIVTPVEFLETLRDSAVPSRDHPAPPDPR